MKLKYLWAACTVFFLVSCSNDDEPPQHGDISVLLLPHIGRLKKTVGIWSYRGLTAMMMQLE